MNLKPKYWLCVGLKTSEYLSKYNIDSKNYQSFIDGNGKSLLYFQNKPIYFVPENVLKHSLLLISDINEKEIGIMQFCVGSQENYIIDKIIENKKNVERNKISKKSKNVKEKENTDFDFHKMFDELQKHVNKNTGRGYISPIQPTPSWPSIQQEDIAKWGERLPNNNQWYTSNVEYSNIPANSPNSDK